MVARLTPIKAERDDHYRAIGRYFVQFSSLVAFMRDQVAYAIVGEDRERQELIRLAFGSLQAQQVSDAFFSVCKATAEPVISKGELAIERCLRENHVNTEIRLRNTFAHGDWSVPEWARVWSASDEPESVAGVVSHLTRVQHHKPTPILPKPMLASEIDAYGERIEALRNMLWEFGMICTRTWDHDPARGLEPVRVRDAFELTGSANDRQVQFRADYGPKLKERGLA